MFQFIKREVLTNKKTIIRADGGVEEVDSGAGGDDKLEEQDVHIEVDYDRHGRYSDFKSMPNIMQLGTAQEREGDWLGGGWSTVNQITFSC